MQQQQQLQAFHLFTRVINRCLLTARPRLALLLLHFSCHSLQSSNAAAADSVGFLGQFELHLGLYSSFKRKILTCLVVRECSLYTRALGNPRKSLRRRLNGRFAYPSSCSSFCFGGAILDLIISISRVSSLSTPFFFTTIRFDTRRLVQMMVCSSVFALRSGTTYFSS